MSGSYDTVECSEFFVASDSVKCSSNYGCHDSNLQITMRQIQVMAHHIACNQFKA